jgi:glycosyltransferase involved in cell wall biosynthesis
VKAIQNRTLRETDLARTPSALRLTYVIGTYPVLTTTFIDREIQILRRLGVSLEVISIRRPNRLLSQVQKPLQSGVHYVLPAPATAVMWSHLSFLISRPLRYVKTLFHLLSRPHPTLRTRLRTILHFGLAVHIARLLRDRYPTDHIHAHFVDRAALVAVIAGRLLGRPFSATAHASDIYVDPVLLPEKMTEAKFIVTCTRYNESHLRSLSPGASKVDVKCIYHGLDIRMYVPYERAPRYRPLLLSVGQLKDRKGMHHLIEACGHLRDWGVDFDCEIVGDGDLRDRLDEMIERLALRDRVSLLGALPHEVVLEKYRAATIFVLPCITSLDGDRDGIPNVILEAMAMGLPIVSTMHSGVPEAVQDGRNGFLVSPGDSVGLADALARLIKDEVLSRAMGRAGRKRVAEKFDPDRNVKKLLSEFLA